MMRNWILLIILIVSLTALTGGTARAQESPSIESIEVALWPEYDQPAMLGLYLVRFSGDAKLPATVQLPLPEGVEEPHVVAAWFPDGRLDDDVDWQVDERSGDRFVTVTVDTTGVWIEFYAPLEFAGSERSYSFRWPGGVSAGSFGFEIMHPVGASDVRVTPQGQRTQGEDGLTYSRLDLGRLASQDTPGIELSYNKPGTIPLGSEQPTGEVSPLTLLEVALWPEYDRQETLVIYRAQLPPETRLPATVRLPVPAEAGDPHAVATIGEDRNLYVAPHELEQEGAWNWVVLESDSLLLQVEYYADLTIEGDRRTFSFSWPGGVQISTMQYEVQRPPGAADLQLTPAGVAQIGQDGLTYIRAALGPQGVGDRVVISLAYQKQDDALTVDAVASQPTLDRPETTQGGTPDLTGMLPWILGAFGATLLGVGLFMLLRTRAERPGTSSSRRRKRRSSRKKETLESSPIYCHVCGSQASASDLFCRRCGTKLRN